MRNGRLKNKSLRRILRRSVSFFSHMGIFSSPQHHFLCRISCAQNSKQIEKIKLDSSFVDILKCDVIWDANIRILDYHKRMTAKLINVNGDTSLVQTDTLYIYSLHHSNAIFLQLIHFNQWKFLLRIQRNRQNMVAFQGNILNFSYN